MVSWLARAAWRWFGATPTVIISIALASVKPANTTSHYANASLTIWVIAALSVICLKSLPAPGLGPPLTALQ